MFPWGPGPRYAALACLLLAACGESPLGASPLTAESGTGGNSSGGGSGGGIIILSPDPDPDECTTGTGGSLDQSILEPQVVEFSRPRSNFFYTWTSLENEGELREGEALLSVGQHPELGRGGAMELLHSAANEEAANGETANEATKAIAAVYQKYRYAWPNPWATRMGWPGESYGDRLVRIELKTEAWIAVLDSSGQITFVYDLEGNEVSLEKAAKEPSRVGAIYFKHAADDCGSGSFSITGSGAYREFILGSPSMIASFSIGSDEIHERLAGDIAALEQYLGEIRENGAGIPSGGTFDSDLFCAWGETCDSYLLGLAIGSEYYRPTPSNLLAILEALNAFDFTAAPYERKGS